MLEGIDGHYEYVFSENIDLFGPSLDVLVVLLHSLASELDQKGRVFVPVVVVFQDFRNELLHEEGGEDVTNLLDCGRQENELHEFDVVGDDGIVEVSVRLKSLHVC